ncbi:hypothetical protein WJX74_004053 [Apatococcus lobatus]|uniref:Uncharacterized protein n=1 Tax=Apatococcus lobatus TaxID=904363 RepID=A0AAW1S6K6_9CHLO
MQLVSDSDVLSSSELCSEIEEALTASGFRRDPVASEKTATEGAQPTRRKQGLSQAARGPDKLKGSGSLQHPLGLLLDKFRSAEAAWLQQKAGLRRAMEGHKKRADKAELELGKLQPLHQARGQEVKGLRAALRQRTQQTSNLEAENARLQQLEGQARSQLAVQLAALTAEREQLQEALHRMEQQLQESAGSSRELQTENQLLQDKVEILQHARQAAVAQAGQAAKEAEGLQASARQHAWGQCLLGTLLTDQLHHNQERADALRTLLTKAERHGELAHQQADTDADDDDSDCNEAPFMKLPAVGRPLIADLKAHLLKVQLQEAA